MRRAGLNPAPFQFGYLRINDGQDRASTSLQLNLAKIIHGKVDLAGSLVAKLALSALVAQ